MEHVLVVPDTVPATLMEDHAARLARRTAAVAEQAPARSPRPRPSPTPAPARRSHLTLLNTSAAQQVRRGGAGCSLVLRTLPPRGAAAEVRRLPRAAAAALARF